MPWLREATIRLSLPATAKLGGCPVMRLPHLLTIEILSHKTNVKKLLIYEGTHISDMNPNRMVNKWCHDRATLAWPGHEHVTIRDKSDSVSNQGWRSSWHWRRSWGRGWLGTLIKNCTPTTCKGLLSEATQKVKYKTRKANEWYWRTHLKRTNQFGYKSHGPIQEIVKNVSRLICWALWIKHLMQA